MEASNIIITTERKKLMKFFMVRKKSLKDSSIDLKTNCSHTVSSFLFIYKFINAKNKEHICHKNEALPKQSSHIVNKSVLNNS